MNDENEIMELSAKLGGAILRKAELENDFEKVYTKVFEKIFEMNFSETEDFLDIFGTTGG